MFYNPILFSVLQCIYMFIILLCMLCDILYILFSLNLFVEVKALQDLCYLLYVYST